jgi:hypothetical protein
MKPNGCRRCRERSLKCIQSPWKPIDRDGQKGPATLCTPLEAYDRGDWIHMELDSPFYDSWFTAGGVEPGDSQ